MENERDWKPTEIRALMRLGDYRPLTLARAIGYSKQSVNDWLAGRSRPRVKARARLTLLEARLWSR